MVRMPLKGNPIPWVVGGAALVAAPVVAVVNKVLGRRQLKKLPIHILAGPGGLEVHISPLGVLYSACWSQIEMAILKTSSWAMMT